MPMRPGVALCALTLLAGCESLPVVGAPDAAVAPPRVVPIGPLRGGFTDVTATASDPVLVRLRSAEDFVLGAVVLGDFDGDGDDDLVVTRSDEQPPWFLRNDRGRFRDETAAWGFARYARTLTGAAADFDGDGRLDLALSTSFPATFILLRNTGERFEPSGFDSGTLPFELIPTMLPEDLDGDGTLDLLVAGMSAPGRCRVNTPGRCRENVQLRAWRQTGPFRFEEQPVMARTGRALALAMVDWDRDGREEVLVAADQGLFVGGNQLLRVERRAGGFMLRDVTAGTGLDVPMAGMGVARIDADEDGVDEVVVTNFGRNLMVRNERGVAREVTDLFNAATYGFSVPGRRPAFRPLDDENPAERVLGIFRDRFLDARSELFMGTKWTALATDFDGDTHQDLYIAASAIGVHDLLPEAPRQHGFLLRGVGRFEDVTERAGLHRTGDHIAAVASDFDGDGDRDLVVHRMPWPDAPGGLGLWRNDTSEGNRFLRVRGRAAGRNTQALGARVEVRVGARVMRGRIEGSTGCFAYGPNEAHFGLGPDGVADEVTVRFPSGRVVTRRAVPAGTLDVVEP